VVRAQLPLRVVISDFHELCSVLRGVSLSLMGWEQIATVQPKYACHRCETGIIQAPAPRRMMVTAASAPRRRDRGNSREAVDQTAARSVRHVGGRI
jgi:hypothetical protein